jgi:hypothetical protein
MPKTATVVITVDYGGGWRDTSTLYVDLDKCARDVLTQKLAEFFSTIEGEEFFKPIKWDK